MNRFAVHATLATLTLIPSHAQESNLANLPAHHTPVPYAGERDQHLTQNLGPTGAQGWLEGNKGHSRDSREILIKSIEPGSPADGMLQSYDIIIGAAVPPNTPACSWKSIPELKPFSEDARLAFARAITWAEGDMGKGELKLLRWRNGKTQPVIIRLPVLGTYSDSAPFNCPKSARVVENAAAFLAEQMPGEGYSVGIGRPHNAGLLLATHDPRYLDHVRRSAINMSLLHTISDAGHETWRWSNTNTFLCEYYLATGDERVLPSIKEFGMALADGQCNPGTWGHRGVPDFIPPGYGSVNSTGIICFYSLILGKQCGVTYADEAIAKSIRFFGSYAGRGALPYGDHSPSSSSASNGKNGAAALAFHMLDAQPAAQWFARLSASSNLRNFEGGHTGNYFNQTWTPLGVQLAGRDNTIAFWKRFLSYRDLARRRDGSFITQPWPHTREGTDGTRQYVNKGPIWSTGSFALSYLSGSERLAMLGRRDSVFAVDAPAELKSALSYYRSRDFGAAALAAAKLKSSSIARVAKLATQLESISERNLASIPLSLESMERNLEDLNLFDLKHQLLAIESVVDPADERLAKFREAVDDPANENHIRIGDLFDNAAKNLSWAGEKGFRFLAPTYLHGKRDHSILLQISNNPTSSHAEAAAKLLSTHPYESHRAGKILATFKSGPEYAPNNTHSMKMEFNLSDTDSIRRLYFTYQKAKIIKLRLNGTLLLDFDIGRPSPTPITLLLKPITLERLKQGKNTMTLEVQPADADFKASLNSDEH